jgi:hypothetical protein
MSGAQANFLDVKFDLLDLEAVERWLAERAPDAPFAYVVTPNVDHVVKLEASPPDAEIRQAYDVAALRLCDSRIVAKLARMRGLTLPVVPGSDLTAHLFDTILRPGDRVCLIGGDAAMLDDLRWRWPALDIVQHIPPMGMLAKPEAMAAAQRFVSQWRCHSRKSWPFVPFKTAARPGSACASAHRSTSSPGGRRARRCGCARRASNGCTASRPSPGGCGGAT